LKRKHLILIPTGFEYKAFLHALQTLGIEYEKQEGAPLPLIYIPHWSAVTAQGGLGKVKFAVSCRYLLDRFEEVESCICLGAAGSLDESLKNGDLVAGTESVEHDIKDAGEKIIPRIPASQQLLQRMISLQTGDYPFKLHFHPIASGDEDIVSPQRKSYVKDRLHCFAVAWEGAGGAQACKFSGISYLELRGISDQANKNTPADFKKNVSKLMKNAADILQLFFTQ